MSIKIGIFAYALMGLMLLGVARVSFGLTDNDITVVNDTGLKKVYVSQCIRGKSSSFCKKRVAQLSGGKGSKISYKCADRTFQGLAHATANLFSPKAKHKTMHQCLVAISIDSLTPKRRRKKSWKNSHMKLCQKLVPHNGTIKLYEILEILGGKIYRSYKCSVSGGKKD